MLTLLCTPDISHRSLSLSQCSLAVVAQVQATMPTKGDVGVPVLRRCRVDTQCLDDGDLQSVPAIGH